MSDDFDWDADDITLFKRHPKTAIYTNPDGDIVIRQEAWSEYDEECFVVIPQERLEAILEALGAYRVGDPAVASPEPRSAAERQRRYRERRDAVTVRDETQTVTQSVTVLRQTVTRDAQGSLLEERP